MKQNNYVLLFQGDKTNYGTILKEKRRDHYFFTLFFILLFLGWLKKQITPSNFSCLQATNLV